MEYSLTKRQKDMLRSILSNLENGVFGITWTTGTRIEHMGNLVIFQDDEEELHELQLPEIWKHSRTSDFDEFVYNGFFDRVAINSYTLNAQKIIGAVNCNFGENEQVAINTSSKSEAVFGEPSSDNEFRCDVFMIMPFAEKFNSIYQDYVRPTVEELGLSMKRGDDFFSHHEIIDEIWSAISASQIVIADCTDRNANVFYELGVAHTLVKITVLITQNIIDVPFDVRGKRFIEYQDNSAGLKYLREKLREYVSKAAKK
jgi:hypothetical protein